MQQLNLIISLINYVTNLQDDFDNFDNGAKKISPMCSNTTNWTHRGNIEKYQAHESTEPDYDKAEKSSKQQFLSSS